MKYMGSKRWMLRNGLGHTLDRETKKAKRFVDLFAGSGAVTAHVATKRAMPIVAYDLQKFSVVLTGALVGRNKKLNVDTIWKEWKKRAARIVSRYTPPATNRVTKASVEQCRQWSQAKTSLPITQAYGGHYFSPMQAVWIDAFRKTLPARDPGKTVALAALIQAASECAASPGHTAQPFQPTRSAKKFLKESWNRDLCDKVDRILKVIAGTHALTVGKASVGDANKVVSGLRKGDLVFIDPPYSGVHYSRFYHVLETISWGGCGPVSGVGRYPNVSERPRSRYSVKSESVDALKKLLKAISSKKASAIVTFPAHECSNGLSGNEAKKLAKEFFSVRTMTVKSKFSTLGGTKGKNGVGYGRAARQHAKELILTLTPKAA
jgi:adenine-specific DNA-methyltransferase